MNKDDIAEAGIKFIEACMLVAQVEAQRSIPRPSARINSVLASDWHHAMSEMEAAKVALYDLVRDYKQEQMAQNIRKVTEPVRVCIECNCLFNSQSKPSRLRCAICVSKAEIQLQADQTKRRENNANV